ncbi:MAG: 30S ribosomal protein S9 [Candidatus Gracilibacteria bacterium]
MQFSGTYFYANGKRKDSVAQVRLYKGNGRVVVNGKDAKEYFKTQDRINVFLAPLVLTKLTKQFDISAVLSGGGLEGQAAALRHGIAKALLGFDVNLRATIKPEGYITRDSRTKERKKFGLHKARRAPQFSKR